MGTISFVAKCSDMFNAELSDGREYEGYVPGFLGGGDYVRLTVDLDTGQIVGWQKPSQEDLDEMFQADASDLPEEDHFPDDNDEEIW